MRTVQRPARPAWAAAGAACSAALLASCLSSCASKGEQIAPEAFGSVTTHSRPVSTAPTYTCEAARRALLSQGFVILPGDGEHVNGRKNFQPDSATHVEIEFHTTCVSDGRDGKKTIVFVNALQDRYALKKNNGSASVGVGAIGSLSLPFISSDDSMVKVASETITSAEFYDKFFELLQRYLADDSALVPEAQPTLVPVQTKATSAPAASGVPVAPAAPVAPAMPSSAPASVTPAASAASAPEASAVAPAASAASDSAASASAASAPPTVAPPASAASAPPSVAPAASAASAPTAAPAAPSASAPASAPAGPASAASSPG